MEEGTSMERIVLTLLAGIAILNGGQFSILAIVAWIAFLCGVCLILPARRRRPAIAYFTGFLLCTCGWLGSDVLLVSCFISLWLLSKWSTSEEPRWASAPLRPLFLFGCGAFAAEIWISSGAPGRLASVYHPTSLIESYMFQDLVRSFLDVWGASWRWLFRVGVLSLTMKTFQRLETETCSIARGIWMGAVIASLYVGLQWFGFQIIVLPNQTDWWTSIRRLSGLASDPNAQGLVFGLALWIRALLFHRSERTGSSGFLETGIPIILVCIGGILTGSRTFFLVAGFLLIAFAVRRSVRTVLVLIASIVAFSSFVTMLDIFFNLDFLLHDRSWMPEGLGRILRSVSLIKISETLSSRLIFWNLALSVAQDHWFYGLGADRFIKYVTLYALRDASLGSWVDNANNFYLGLLAEGGIGAVLGFIVSVIGYRFYAGPKDFMATFCVMMIFSILLVGPHIDFIEVLMLVGLLIGTFTRERRIAQRISKPIGILLLMLGFMVPHFRELGVYSWEYEGPNRATRWIAPYATVQIPCHTNETTGENMAELVLRTSYTPSVAQLTTQIVAQGNERKTIELSPGMPHAAQFVCAQEKELLALEVSTNIGWRPAKVWPKRTSDNRVLAVQQVFTAPLGNS